eukprot:m.131188 g.131188  ORF g.131188 m.131188 type:complete len:327 (-) comp9476_c1_seq3:1111-2091(-)
MAPHEFTTTVTLKRTIAGLGFTVTSGEKGVGVIVRNVFSDGAAFGKLEPDDEMTHINGEDVRKEKLQTIINKLKAMEHEFTVKVTRLHEEDESDSDNDIDAEENQTSEAVGSYSTTNNNNADNNVTAEEDIDANTLSTSHSLQLSVSSFPGRRKSTRSRQNKKTQRGPKRNNTGRTPRITDVCTCDVPGVGVTSNVVIGPIKSDDILGIALGGGELIPEAEDDYYGNLEQQLNRARRVSDVYFSSSATNTTLSTSMNEGGNSNNSTRCDEIKANDGPSTTEDNNEESSVDDRFVMKKEEVEEEEGKVVVGIVEVVAVNVEPLGTFE